MAVSTPRPAATAAIAIAESRSIAMVRANSAGSSGKVIDSPTRIVTMEPVAAAMSGANSLSHIAPGARNSASISVSSSAAATGEPNIAPRIPAVATMTTDCVGVCGHHLAAIHTDMPTAIAMMGFSGPRLTPPASPMMSAIATPGSAYNLSGAETSSVVAGSVPPWPGMSHTVTPTATPVAVRTAMIQKVPSEVTPRASGNDSHSAFCN